jgi:hypothetical protein
MNTLSILVGLILFAAAVLQIILFFKVWAMTNDVRELRAEHTPHRDTLFEVRKLLLLGDSKKVVDILVGRFAAKIKNSSYVGLSDYECSEEMKKSIDAEFEKAKKELESSLKKVGVEMPESIKRLKSGNDFHNLFTFN